MLCGGAGGTGSCSGTTASADGKVEQAAAACQKVEQDLQAYPRAVTQLHVRQLTLGRFALLCDYGVQSTRRQLIAATNCELPQSGTSTVGKRLEDAIDDRAGSAEDSVIGGQRDVRPESTAARDYLPKLAAHHRHLHRRFAASRERMPDAYMRRRQGTNEQTTLGQGCTSDAPRQGLATAADTERSAADSRPAAAC